MYKFEDYTELELKPEQKEKCDSAHIPYYSKRDVRTNLGMYKTKTAKGDVVRTDKYCGYVWLKDANGNVIRENDEDIILHICPRFGLDLNAMLQKIAGDDEFFEYLGLETKDPLIHFFYGEPLIDNVSVKDNMNQLIPVISFIVLLEKITRISVIKRMVNIEENAVAKLRGHIQMNKQISKNIFQGHKERIYSAHNERSEDNTENRILLYVLKKAEDYLQQVKSGGSPIDGQILRKVALVKNRLNKVNLSEHNRFDCEDIDKVIIKLPNIYRNYISVFEYAKLILLEASVNVDADSNSAKVVPYAVNSHMLYECYARACIKECIQELSKDEQKIEMLKYVRDKDNIPEDPMYGAKEVIGNKAGGGNQDQCYIAGKIVPDIVLKYTEHNANTGSDKEFFRVYDVKYKDASKRYRGRDDRLQLLAYNLLYKTVNNTGFVFPYGGEGYKILNLNGCGENNQGTMWACQLIIPNAEGKSLLSTALSFEEGDK